MKNPLKCKISPEFGMTQVKLCSEDEDDESGESLDGIGSDVNSRVLKVVGRAGFSFDVSDQNAWIQQIKEFHNLIYANLCTQ